MLLGAAHSLGIERHRPLLPVGYRATVEAYQRAAQGLRVEDLSSHYTDGMAWFHGTFAQALRARLEALSGGAWDLSGFELWGAGADTDLMAHLLEATSAREEVALYPGGWFGFLVGGTWDQHMVWTEEPNGRFAAICVPSVRNGHFTEAMGCFVDGAGHALLNLNLFPTLRPEERHAVAERLALNLERAVLSVSFSRGFGLTASQLGVALVHRDNPLWARHRRQWAWHSYFHNALAARAFLELDLDAVQAVDVRRRRQVEALCRRHGLPVVETGSYYVKSYRPVGELPAELSPLLRGDVVRFCFKPEAV